MRFVHAVPLKASHAAGRGTGIAYWAMGADKVQHLRWGTDLRVSRRKVVSLMRGGRAHGKRAHATCHTLKNQGDTFAHPYGHGAPHLSVVVAVVRRRALVVDQPPQLCCALCRAVWTRLGRKRLVGERLRAWGDAYCLDSMRALGEALWYGVEKPRPLLPMDPS